MTLCDVQTCAGRAGNNLSGINCNGGYLTGFDNKGRKICKNLSDLWSCPTGQVMTGFDTNNNVICRDDSLCASGEYLRGFNLDGTKNCVLLASSEKGDKGDPGESIEPPRVPGVIQSAPAASHTCKMVDNIHHGRICACNTSARGLKFGAKIGHTCYGCPDGSTYYNRRCYTCSGSGTPVNGVCVLR